MEDIFTASEAEPCAARSSSAGPKQDEVQPKQGKARPTADEKVGKGSRRANPMRTNCIWAVSCRRQERNILGVYAEMPDLFAIALRGEDQRGEDYSFLCWEGECGMATAICFLVCPNRMLDYWTPSGRQSHQRVDSGGEERGGAA